MPPAAAASLLCTIKLRRRRRVQRRARQVRRRRAAANAMAAASAVTPRQSPTLAAAAVLCSALSRLKAAATALRLEAATQWERACARGARHYRQKASALPDLHWHTNTMHADDCTLASRRRLLWAPFARYKQHPPPVRVRFQSVQKSASPATPP